LNPESSRSVAASKLLLDLMEKGESSEKVIPLTEMSMADLKQLAADMFDVFDDREAIDLAEQEAAERESNSSKASKTNLKKKK